MPAEKGQKFWTKARKAADPEGWAQEKASRRAAKKARDAEHYAKNKDQLLAQQAEYRAKNRDREIARKVEYYAKNKDKTKARRQTKDGKLTVLVACARNRHTWYLKQPKETFALSKEKLLALWEKQGGCDPYTGVPLVPESNQPGTVSVDRIDNSLGYVEGNVALVTAFWNYARNDTTIEDTLRGFAVHVEYFIPKQGPRNAAALVRKAIAHFNPAEREAFLRELTPQKKPKRVTAEVLPLFSPKKEPA
jgi:hypothetical protein